MWWKVLAQRLAILAGFRRLGKQTTSFSRAQAQACLFSSGEEKEIASQECGVAKIYNDGRIRKFVCCTVPGQFRELTFI